MLPPIELRGCVGVAGVLVLPHPCRYDVVSCQFVAHHQVILQICQRNQLIQIVVHNFDSVTIDRYLELLIGATINA